MIDFKNGSFVKLMKAKKPDNVNTIQGILLDGETVLAEYTAIRDFVIFTDKRIIAVNVQGLTGKKKDFTSIPYSKIQVFSVETAGTLDLDAELEVFISGVGAVKFEFVGGSDIVQIGKLISEKIL